MPSTENAATAGPVRVGLLDDHEVILDSVASWIGNNAPDFTLAVAANRWLDFVRSEDFPVDVVLMDFQLVEPVSIEARIRTCRAAGAKVIVISALDSAEARARASSAGALAFLSKALPMAEVMASVRSALRMPEPTSGVADRVASTPGALAKPQLSPGERQALILYVTGRSTIEVGEAMDVKYETAKTYLRRVREKYQKVGRPASRKSDLIRRAAEDGFLE
ncbi:response regulator transcription factor [Leifsonia sp. Leaf264]|uniref:response regulator transcription factor n=1 Tax=Leifsonia sp. Leaf264 TaxID=1736314 RepID=UPI0006FC2E9A|nr:response regulator [Leifsonia sp. Leaf264]KQO95423.1 two-component system response regulator [Leifsonia sp. Leaf264]